VKILIAEDNFTDRLILRKIVEQQGYQVCEAENGVEAIEVFNKEQPDLILLDALMPKLDGFNVARKLKADHPEAYIPIIFITSLTETESLVKCIEAGGDDFFTKPFNRVILQAKITAFKRAKALYQTVLDQKQEIEFHTQHMMQEQQIAKRIFDNIAHKGALGDPCIRYSVSPMSVFNGDILLAAKRPLGGMNVFLGDFTGHGLSASIGALPVSDIFFGMTAKGFELYEIVKELNNRLKSVLPVGFFCCAIAAEIDFEDNNIKVWNGGLPDAYLINKHTAEVEEIKSNHLPLGIIGEEKFQAKMDVRPFNDGDSLFLYSDGVIESENEAGELFGLDRLLVSICDGASRGEAFDRVTEAVKAFRKTTEQGDDITYMEIKNHKERDVQAYEEVDEVFRNDGPSDSCLNMELGPRSLKNYNPLPSISQHLMEIGNLRSYRTQVMTIITELYSNALEHGVLGLGSELKKSADGFAEYYRQREDKLTKLEHGYINIKVTHKNLDSGGQLELIFEDSGQGFDYKTMQDKASSSKLSGRGYPLVIRLAESVEFFNNGSSVRVIFSWKATGSK
jgi:CheY-like chemotaxis protein